MIGYITVGTNDMEKSAKYYDALLAEMGAKRFMEMDTFIAWSNNPTACGFSITKPFDGNPASVGNGVMVALQLDSTDKVDALYAKAIELGGTDEGAPGARSDNFYAGYFRDLDGNKLNFFCMT
mgnify:FL=1